MIKITLADDHPIVRQGMRKVLESESDFNVVGEAGDGLAALRMIEELQPDIAVLDMLMPHLNGLSVLQQVTKRFPNTRVVMLTMHHTEAYVLQALRNGAAGYIVKDAGLDEMVTAIREVAAGKRYLSAPISHHAINAYIEKAKSVEAEGFELLTEREQEVMQLAAEGFTNAEIGERLFLSPRTVETHRANFMRKLELRTQMELVRYALMKGIIALNE